jgi:hypothetical protein
LVMSNHDIYVASVLSKSNFNLAHWFFVGLSYPRFWPCSAGEKVLPCCFYPFPFAHWVSTSNFCCYSLIQIRAVKSLNYVLLSFAIVQLMCVLVAVGPAPLPELPRFVWAR